MSFDWLSLPFEEVDHWLHGLLAGAPLLATLAVACLLGLRHASDPDHLFAVTSLVAADGGDTRGAMRLGAWWGAGHAATLLLAGIPLVLLSGSTPGWLEQGAEKLIGVLIVVLAVRLLLRWLRGDLRRPGSRPSGSGRSGPQSAGIGVLHGLAGTGAVVVVLAAQIPSQVEATLALALFAAMSVISMTACSGGFAWTLTRPATEPIYRSFVIPALGVTSIMFGGWYAGVLA